MDLCSAKQKNETEKSWNRLLFSLPIRLSIRCAVLILFLAVAFVILIPVQRAMSSDSSNWITTGNLSTLRGGGVDATLLKNGKVLISGGMVTGNGPFLSSAELYDPSSGVFSPTGSMNQIRETHTGTLLPNGKVLIVGGYPNYSSAELYDPNTGNFTLTGSLNQGRMGHTATLLPNGKVLITGGRDNNSRFSSAELYDPSTGAFSLTGSMSRAYCAHRATLLATGKVLITGGDNGDGANATESVDLYDPSTGIFTPTGNMLQARQTHTATILANGKVLVAGGYINGPLTTNTAELYGTVKFFV